MSKKVGVHFKQRSRLKYKSWQRYFSQIHADSDLSQQMSDHALLTIDINLKIEKKLIKKNLM